MTLAGRLLLAAHFACPLIFFTDLTRNPYVTQIALLNLLLLGALAAWAAPRLLAGEFPLRRTPMDLPLAAWTAVCVLSWLWAYWGHAEFYRPAMRSEGMRAFLFLGGNALLPYFLAANLGSSGPDEPEEPAGAWALLVVVWGGLWLLFPQLRSASGSVTSLVDHVWDPYGGLLWAGGLAAVLYLARSGTIHAFWHLALSVGVLAGVYACFQYFRLDFLWPRTLDPYGGRSVSTFGNPNFMSSYMVMLLPLATVYYLQARSRARRVLYAGAFLVLEAGLLCSLTRSSWVGAAAALAPLAFSRRLRRQAGLDLEAAGLAATAAVLLAALWPRSGAAGYVPGLVDRLAEVRLILAPDGPDGYSPWHQRVLIWACAWVMGAENPLLGKGWGLFELFYPFYQGHFLRNFDLFRIMRTHANNTHNELLEVWAQTGIAGLGVFLWAWTAFFRSLIPAAFGGGGLRAPSAGGDARRPAPEGDPWLLAAGGGVLGMLADNMLNVSVHFAVPAFLFWWQAGAAMGRLASRDGWSRKLSLPTGAGRWAAAAALAALAGGCAWYWTGYWNREVRYFMGFKLMRRGDARQAVALLRQAYDWSPRDVNNNYELGNGYARSEQFEQAIWAYQEALRANAGYDEIYFNLGTVQARLGRLEDAWRNYLVSWAINPHSAQTYTHMINLYLQAGASPERRPQAVEILSEAVRFFPQDVNFLNNLGYLHSVSGRTDKAEELYSRILRLDPDSAVAERNLRTSLAQSGRPAPEVLRDIEDYRRLKAMMGARRLDRDALAAARKVHERFPESLETTFYLGTLELMNGGHARAEELYRDVLRRQPGSAAALANLAQALKAQGRRSEAADALRAALEAEPGDQRLRAELESLR